MREREEASASTKLTYLLIGGGIGAILALLFAPKSGQELREDIADVTRKGLEKSKQTANQLQERAGEYYEVTRDRANELIEQGKGKANELYSQAQDKAEEIAEKAKATANSTANPFSAAIEAGKKAYLDEKRKTESASIKDGRAEYPIEDEDVLKLPEEIKES
jgi:gas vesicle protein